MAAMNIEVAMPRRRAIAKLHQVFAKRLDLPIYEGKQTAYYGCFVLAVLAEADAEGSTPVFVCEFLNGHVGNVYTENVTFLDTEEGVLKE